MEGAGEIMDRRLVKKFKMKSLIKKFTTQEQRRQLCLFYQSSMEKISGIFGFFVNLFPAPIKVFLKAHLKIHKPLDYPKEKILIDVSSGSENSVRRRSCAKEPETVQWIEGFKKGEVFWDIGANIGAYSLVAAKYHRGSVPVYAMEPSFLNFSQLCKNIAINKCDDIVTPFNIALSEKTQMGKFNYQNFDIGGALHAFGEPIDFKKDEFVPVFKQNLMSFKMDDLIDIFLLPLPTHVKLDVDGIELKIFQGGPHVLSKTQSLLVEIGKDDNELLAYLNGIGFKLDKKFSIRHVSMANCIFRRPS